MFGLNDDDKHHQDQAQPQLSQDDNQTSSDDTGAAQFSSHDSPFAAAYSSLNSSNDDSTDDAQSAPTIVDDHSVPEEDLLQLKTQALKSLAPLVGHLDQTPEEKFKTTMMMIQASDNAELIRDAYNAASQIEDEKARAQALLDVINEINYFTQHASKD